METLSIRNGSLMALAAFVIIVAGMKAAAVLVVPFLMAVFLATICAPPLFWMQDRGIPTGLGILLLLLAVMGIQLILVSLVSASIAEFSNNIPFYQERLRRLSLDGLQILASHGIQFQSDQLISTVDPGRVLGLAANTLNGIGGILTNMFFVFLTLIFILSEAAGFPVKIKVLFGGEEKSGRYNQIIAGVNRYLGIKTLTSLATGATIWLWLMLQGVDFPVMWGVFAFLLNYIPNIGSIIAAVPAVLLALVQLGPMAAAVSGMGFLLVNVVVGSVIEPRIMGQGTGLSALVVFLSLSFWGWILGPVGMLLSVPLTMAVKIALGGRQSSRWVSVLLGSNKDAAILLDRE